MLIVKIVLFGLVFLTIAMIYGGMCKRLFPDIVKDMGHILIFGTIAFWAVFYLISIPLIFMKCSMDTLTWLMCGITFFFLIVMLILFKKEKLVLKTNWKKLNVSKTELLMLLAFLLLMFKQIYGYVVLQHTDADDAEFVVFATSAVQNNELLSVNPYTGTEIWDSLFIKRGMNPFPLLIAFYSKISDIHPAIMSHTVMPVALLLLVYMICWMIGGKIFKTREERVLFIVLIALLHTYGAASEYTNSSFFLLRLWQGKAVLAALVMPLVLYGCLNYSKEKRRESIAFLVMLGLAGTLTSAISYVVIPIEIMAFFVALAIRDRRFFIIIDGLVSCTPSLLCGSVFFVFMYLVGVV